MKPGEYPYPADEFDAAAASAGPRGVHRTPRSRWSRWWPFLLVLVLFPALAYGAVTILSGTGNLPGATGTTSSAADTGTTDESTATDEATTPAEPPATESAAPVVTPTPEPAPVADLTRAVEVLNSTQISGLAGGARDRVEAAGFTNVTTGNFTGTDPDASIVYYTAAADITTAQAVAAALGLTAVQESADDAPDGIVVVLASDYDA
ncbi:MAG: LytR family transcriptional regulator [Cellulomonadaceae bacterium]|nr:LytR family transcriptional regulator [Cellulomonadaceae bacterium]